MDAWYIPIHELVDEGDIEDGVPRKVKMADFIASLKKRRKSVTKQVEQRYYEWAKEMDTR